MDSYTLERVTQLLAADIDMVKSYSEALNVITDQSIINSLKIFREDHREHHLYFLEVLQDFDVSPGDLPNLQNSYTTAGFLPVAPNTDLMAVLTILLENERAINALYARAELWKTDPLIYGQIERNFEDEEDHVTYLEELLMGRSKAA